MLSQQLQAASTFGLLQMGQIICHVRVNHIAIQKMLKEVYVACLIGIQYIPAKNSNQIIRDVAIGCVCVGGYTPPPP